MRARLRARQGNPPDGNWKAREPRGSLPRMKLFVALLLVVALAAAVLCVPLGGRTAWQRAEAKGLPRSVAHAVAHAVAHGFRASWDWLASVHSVPAHSAAAHSLPRHPSRRALAEAQLQGAPPAEAHDGIVRAPPTETHAQGDRAALDQLLQKR